MGLQDRLAAISSSAVARINPALRRHGVELVHCGGGRRPWSHRINRPVLPPPYRSVVAQREPRIGVDGTGAFEVPIERCTTGYLFSYSDGGWHPLVRALDVAPDGPEAVEGFLAAFYGAFQPRTIAELFGADSRTVPDHMPQWPLLPEIVRGLWNVNPWWLRRRLASADIAQGERAGSVYLGPQTQPAVAAEAKRLLDLYESVAARGYQPVDRGHRIAGYFLVRGSDYRFVLSSGNHRVAVLKSLGYRHCTATLMPGLPYAVNYDQLSRWTTRRGGVYEPDIAEWLFTRFFDVDGREAAARLALTRSGR